MVQYNFLSGNVKNLAFHSYRRYTPAGMRFATTLTSATNVIPVVRKETFMLSERAPQFIHQESNGLPIEESREGQPAAVADRVVRTCPGCGQEYRFGELICSKCGLLFHNELRTNRLEDVAVADLERNKRIGVAITDQFRPLNVLIADQMIEMPFAAVMVLGRSNDSPGAESVDFDLSPYNALEKGVSRNHARITRDRELIHVTDLGSTNGTFLNGFRLVANQERILRSGDELMLGRLKVVVKF